MGSIPRGQARVKWPPARGAPLVVGGQIALLT
jgi:hypothetical protein